MAKEFEANPEIKINAKFGTMDATLNDVDLKLGQYPTFYLFVEGRKEYPIQYNGGLDYVDVKNFIFDFYKFQRLSNLDLKLKKKMKILTIFPILQI